MVNSSWRKGLLEELTDYFSSYLHPQDKRVNSYPEDKPKKIVSILVEELIFFIKFHERS